MAFCLLTLPVTDPPLDHLPYHSLSTLYNSISHSTMQTLQTAEWYNSHPKPFGRDGRNLDHAICRTGLRLSNTEYTKLSKSILTALLNDGVPLNEASGLRRVDIKERIKAVLRTVAGNVGHQYGWSEVDEIDGNIIPDYMFEMAKKSANDHKRRAKTVAPTGSNRPAASGALPETSRGTPPPPPPQHTGPPQQSFIPPPLRQELQSPALSGPSTSLQNISVGRPHPLRMCNIYVKQVGTGLEYEDTIDTFLKAEFKKLSKDIEFGPHDFDFTLFKQELTETLSYEEESDLIFYTHAQKGEVEVNYDWK